MSLSRLRMMVARLDDAALEALSSRGLIRRATADVTAGKVMIEREEEDRVELTVDGEKVSLVLEGLAKADCSCPAPGICRHRLAAAIALRESGESLPADVEGVGWAAVFAAITPSEIARFAGKSAWQEALERHQRSGPAALSMQGSTCSVALDPSEPPVVFLASGGLPAAITKARQRVRKAHIAAAALAARRAFGLPSPEEAESPAVTVRNAPSYRVLAEVRDFLARCYATGLAVASAALEEEARRLALAGRTEALPRLASLLRQIGVALGSLRRRDANADGGELLSLLAEAYALSVAVDAAAEPLRTRLAGEVRQEYADVGDLELFGLGARLWQAPSGAHGVTSYHFAPDSGQTYTLTFARPDRTDVQFHPIPAFHHSPVWGETMARLCAGHVQLSGAQASAAGRLSTSAVTRSRIADWSPSREVARHWTCAFDDWAILESRLQPAFTPRLSSDRSVDTVVVLIFSKQAPARFDELTQTLTWPLADARGRWVGLTLAYEGAERASLAALERLTQSERYWAVLAVATAMDGRIDLRPYALWGKGQRLLDFSPAADEKPSDHASILERIRRLASHTASRSPNLIANTSATDAALDRTWHALLRRAEMGGKLASELFGREITELSNALEIAGLSTLTPIIRRLSQSGNPVDCLRAAYALSVARRAKARLAWMA